MTPSIDLTTVLFVSRSPICVEFDYMSDSEHALIMSGSFSP